MVTYLLLKAGMAIGQLFFSIQKKRKRNMSTLHMSSKPRLFQKYKLQIGSGYWIGSHTVPCCSGNFKQGGHGYWSASGAGKTVGDVNLKKSNATMPWWEGGKQNWIVKPALPWPQTFQTQSWCKAQLFSPLGTFFLSYAQYANAFPKSMIHL